MSEININKQIAGSLFSTDLQMVLSGLNRLKEEGNHLYLPILFDILLSNPAKEVEQEIKKILASVKGEESIPVFMKAVADEKYQKIQKTLLESCWQNGLYFGNYLSELIEIVINNKMEIAFEAFTIIENLEKLPAENLVNKGLEIIDAELNNKKTNNEFFLTEIKKQLSREN